MKTFSIVSDKGTVITFQADSDDTSEYIQRLRTQVEQATVTLAQRDSEITVSQDLTSQLAAKDSEIAALKEENDRLKTTQTDSVDTEAINKKASEIALGMFKILPSILQLDANYDIGATPKSPIELMRDYLVLVNPARKAELEAMNFDESPTGIRNSALVEGMYQVTKDLSSTNKQQSKVNQDSASTPSSEMAALQRLLRGTLITDSSESSSVFEQRQKDQISAIDSNF